MLLLIPLFARVDIEKDVFDEEHESKPDQNDDPTQGIVSETANGGLVLDNAWNEMDDPYEEPSTKRKTSLCEM